MAPGQARLRYHEGGFVPTSLCVDAKSVYAAVTATFIKTPAEKSLLCHVQYLRQQLDRKVLTALMWLDTRDMGADGLTKGAVSREALHELMDGCMRLRHAYEQWQSKGSLTGNHLVPGGRELERRGGGGDTEATARDSHLVLSSFCALTRLSSTNALDVGSFQIMKETHRIISQSRFEPFVLRWRASPGSLLCTMRCAVWEWLD